MISFGKLYAHTLKYPHKNFLPVVELGWTNEIDEPYRDGKCLVFRAPWTTKGFVIGLWDNSSAKDEETGLLKAIEGKQISLDIVSELRDPVWVPEDDEDVQEK